MKTKHNEILLTTPALSDQGGVASYFNAIAPFLADVNILEIGSTKGGKSRFYHITDQLRFRKAISARPALVHVNPSLNIKSFIRDGLFVWQAKRKGLPVLVFFHGWRKDFEQVVSSRLLWFFKRTFGQADAFIVLASEFKKVLQQWGVSQPIFQGTTNVDEALLAGFSLEDKAEQVRRADKLKILFLSRLEREKGVFETVDAATALISKKIGTRTRNIFACIAGHAINNGLVLLSVEYWDRFNEFAFYLIPKKEQLRISGMVMLLSLILIALLTMKWKKEHNKHKKN